MGPVGILQSDSLDQPVDMHCLIRPFTVCSPSLDTIECIRNIIVYTCLDNSEYQVNIFLISHKNICCGYSLEAPH